MRRRLAPPLPPRVCRPGDHRKSRMGRWAGEEEDAAEHQQQKLWMGDPVRWKPLEMTKAPVESKVEMAVAVAHTTTGQGALACLPSLAGRCVVPPMRDTAGGQGVGRRAGSRGGRERWEWGVAPAGWQRTTRTSRWGGCGARRKTQQTHGTPTFLPASLALALLQGMCGVCPAAFSNSLPEPSLHPPSRVSPPLTRTHTPGCLCFCAMHAALSLHSATHT